MNARESERVNNASIFFYPSVCAAMFVKKSEVHILYHKELADARIIPWQFGKHEGVISPFNKLDKGR